jgi:hypothetical protein
MPGPGIAPQPGGWEKLVYRDFKGLTPTVYYHVAANSRNSEPFISHILSDFLPVSGLSRSNLDVVIAGSSVIYGVK